MENKSFILAIVVSVSLLFSAGAYATSADQKATAKKQTKNQTSTKTVSSNEPAVTSPAASSDVSQSACANCTYLPVITGTFDIASNYIFRGISNSGNAPAYQGGLTATFIKGLYVSTWGSNVDLIDHNGDTATLELDTNAGIANKVGENWNYDLHITRYNYPESHGLAYNEVIGSLGYRWLTGLIGYSSNVFGSGGNGTYYNLGVKYPLPFQSYVWKNIALSGGVGYYDLPNSKGLKSYADYNLGVSKTIGIYNLALMWVDTNHNSVDADNLKDSKIVGMVTANF